MAVNEFKPDSADVMQAAMQAYGYDGAKELFVTLFDSIEQSSDELRPPDGITKIALSFGDTSQWLGLQGTYIDLTGFGLKVDPRYPVSEIVGRIPAAVHHEIAHAVRWQKANRFHIFWGKDGVPCTFSSIIDEGLACETQRERFGDDYDISTDFRLKTLLGYAHGLVQKPHEILPAAQYDAYLLGNGRNRRLGYAVGQFIVSEVGSDGYDYDALSSLPDREYHRIISDKLADYNWSDDETAA